MKYELGQHGFFLHQRTINLGEQLPKSTYRVSRNGVPHLVVDGRYSVCYFSAGKFWRIFYPYPSNPEAVRRTDFKTEVEVIRYFQDKRRVSL